VFERQKPPPPVAPTPDPVPVDPHRHTLRLAGMPDDTCEWIISHGYTAAAVGVPGCRYGGVLYARRNQDVRLAAIGDTLLWDGADITVEAI
jgi:hypothetical protein